MHRGKDGRRSLDPLVSLLRKDESTCLRLALDELQAEAFRDMPGDMAVHNPSPRVVELQRDVMPPTTVEPESTLP